MNCLKEEIVKNGHPITIGPGWRYNLRGWNVGEHGQTLQQRLGPEVVELLHTVVSTSVNRL